MSNTHHLALYFSRPSALVLGTRPARTAVRNPVCALRTTFRHTRRLRTPFGRRLRTPFAMPHALRNALSDRPPWLSIGLFTPFEAVQPPPPDRRASFTPPLTPAPPQSSPRPSHRPSGPTHHSPNPPDRPSPPPQINRR